MDENILLYIKVSESANKLKHNRSVSRAFRLENNALQCTETSASHNLMASTSNADVSTVDHACSFRSKQSYRSCFGLRAIKQLFAFLSVQDTKG